MEHQICPSVLTDLMADYFGQFGINFARLRSRNWSWQVRLGVYVFYFDLFYSTLIMLLPEFDVQYMIALGNIGYLFLGPENRNFINIMCLTWRTMCITLMNQFLYSDYRWLTLADQQLGRLPRWMEIDKPRIGRLVYRIRLTIYLLTGLLFTFVEI